MPSPQTAPTFGSRMQAAARSPSCSASTGSLVKVISGSKYKFNQPEAVASDGTHVWVANYGGNSVTELNALTGALVDVISGRKYGFAGPRAITTDGSDVSGVES